MLTAGSVDCWGDNAFGDLGDGVTGGPDGEEVYDTPQPVSGLTGATSVVSDGIDGYCALLASGGVDCWGSDDVGQLGNGTVTVQSGSGGSVGYDTPQPVTGVGSAVALASDGYGYCALLSGGGIDCWGSNANGDLGDGTVGGTDGQNGYDTPQAVSGIGTASSVVSGPGGYCAVVGNGQVDCWGNNRDGELGNGQIDGPDPCVTGDDCYDTPQPVIGESDAVAVTNTGIGYCATQASGAVDCWGYNEDGQIGDGTIGGTDGDYGYDTRRSRSWGCPLRPAFRRTAAARATVSSSPRAAWTAGDEHGRHLGDGDVGGPDGKFGYDLPQAVVGVGGSHGRDGSRRKRLLRDQGSDGVPVLGGQQVRRARERTARGSRRPVRLRLPSARRRHRLRLDRAGRRRSLRTTPAPDGAVRRPPPLSRT